MRTISELHYFNTAHPYRRTYRNVHPSLIETYSGQLPELIIETWRESGLQCFSHGFLWMVNPDEYREVIEDFVYDYQISQIDVLFRSCFGDMIFAYDGRFYHFCAVTGKHAELTGSLESILEIDLAQQEFLDSIFFFDLFMQARNLLGELSEEELYGFFPAIQLGGTPDVMNLQKVNLLTHLHFLSQL